MTEPAACPGCGGSKTPRARLCKACRHRATGIGVAAVIRTRTLRGRWPAEQAITAAQISAVHGMAAKLDKLNRLPRRATHDRALAHATQILGRQVASVTELDRREASLVLDWLEEQLVALELAATA